MSAAPVPGPDNGPDTQPMSSAGAYVLDACLHSSTGADIYRVHVADGGRDPGFPLVMKLAHAGAGDQRHFLHSEVEHQVLPRLRGAHVPRVVETLELIATPRLVMERIFGHSLQSWRTAEQRPGTEEVLRLGVAMARAVHEVHRQHAVHHDLQPAHVMIRSDQSAVLLGWGRAWHAQLPDLLSGLSAREQADSAAWLAPELLLGRRGDPRSDIYAIGVMLYDLLAGVQPFGEPRSPVGMRRRLWQIPVSLRRRNPAVTPWLESVVQRCLAPEAASRYPSAAHLAFDLLHPQAMPAQASPVNRWQQALGHRLRGAVRALGLTAASGRTPLPGESGVPIVLLALTLAALDEPQAVYLQEAVRRALGVHPYARLLCVTVLPASLAPAQRAQQDRGSLERRWLARLRVWARPLGQPGREAVCRVLSADDAAQALKDCICEHEISELVLSAGNWAEQTEQRLAHEAACNVLLVRPPKR